MRLVKDKESLADRKGKRVVPVPIRPLDRKPGRQTKLTPDLVNAMWSLYNEDSNTVLCTDEELVMLINERLEPQARIKYITFANWKSGIDVGGADKQTIEIFMEIVKRARTLKKLAMLGQLQTEPISWQRWAWLLERKHEDLNLKAKAELTGTNGGPLQIQVVNYAVNPPKNQE